MQETPFTRDHEHDPNKLVEPLFNQHNARALLLVNENDKSLITLKLQYNPHNNTISIRSEKGEHNTTSTKLNDQLTNQENYSQAVKQWTEHNGWTVKQVTPPHVP